MRLTPRLPFSIAIFLSGITVDRYCSALVDNNYGSVIGPEFAACVALCVGYTAMVVDDLLLRERS